ncbi:hypothetical protein ACEWY4_019794 [Coilia grayii]|uniref:Peptidase S1 domain-containing protein n=1 Tax=Coilia grayii TaxID=363190 RepID=A0ABD1JDY7_9TELE
MRHLLLLVTLGCVGMTLGKDCRPFARPWLVIFDERKSGALLNEYWVLTSFSHNARPSEIRSPHFDLALVRLAWPARFTPQVQPIPLPTQPTQTRKHCVASGWGSTIPYKCENIPKISRKQQCLHCHNRGDPNIFCAGYEDTAEGNCLRDEGSILVCGGVLYGVNAKGPDGCSGRPETYSSVYAYKDWINEVMYPEICTTSPPTTTPTTEDLSWGRDSTV